MFGLALLTGRFVGRRVRVARCIECRARLDEAMTACPGCRAAVVGDAHDEAEVAMRERVRLDVELGYEPGEGFAPPDAETALAVARTHTPRRGA